jgi:hypothetical protein
MPPWADTSSRPAEGSPEAKRRRLGVWHPHPDDDVSPERGSTGQTPAHSDAAPLKMFHRYYDRYLDNYEGYVKLAQRLYLMREKGEVPPGSGAEQEWEEKLRRATPSWRPTIASLGAPASLGVTRSFREAAGMVGDPEGRRLPPPNGATGSLVAALSPPQGALVMQRSTATSAEREPMNLS